MRKIITILVLTGTFICFAQTTEVKPTALLSEIGGSHLGVSIKLNRVYKIKPNIAYTYEFGASPFKENDLQTFDPTLSVSWSALIFSKNSSHLELGFSTVIDSSTEPLFTLLIAYRYQNLTDSRTFARFGIIPIGADGSGIGFTSVPALGLGYTIK